MKKVLSLFVIIFLCVNLNAQTSGGPDAYGYTWKNSSHTVSPPTYSWFDITSIGTQVTGLSDDNFVGPFSCTGFQFYWYPVHQFWIGSNGYISFVGENISSTFTNTVPLSSGANNWIAPFLSDLNFSGLGNTASCYYYANSDTVCVSFINVPYWATGVNYTGSNTFQIILNKVDKSITFNYLSRNAGTVTTVDIVAGMENNTGTLGLAALIDVYPANASTYKFYYPSTVTYAVTDGGVNWNGNKGNAAIFIKSQLDSISLITDIKNFGNQSLSSFSVKDTVYNAQGTPITSGTAVVPAITMGVDTILTLSNTFVAPTAGIYSFNTAVSGITGDMVVDNNRKQQKIIAINTANTTMTLDYSDGVRDGDIGWNGGNGGVAIYIEPPFYPAKIVSSKFNIYSNATSPVGFHAMIFDDDGANGNAGTLLDSVFVPGSGITTNVYTVVPTSSSNLVIDSGGVYLLWLMDSASIRIATDDTPPISMRTFEVLSGGWSAYRSIQTEDFLMGINIQKTTPTADFFADISQDPIVQFSDSTNNNPTTWLWNFGYANDTSTLQNPSYTYPMNGTFNVCLKVTNLTGADSICKNVVISNVSPVADFGIDTTSSPTVLFSDSSTGPPISWLWNFDEGAAISTIQNPSHTYLTNGAFNVCLIALNNAGLDSICKSVIINTILSAANFSYDTTNMPTIAFTDSSTASPTSWLWDFDNNGAISNLQNPTFTFTVNGIHNVCLTPTNVAGVGPTVCKNINIRGVGINEIAKSDKLIIYPNPFSDKTIIEINSTNHYSNLNLKCYNIMGELINVSFEVNNNRVELNKGDLNEGTYFFELYDNETILGKGKLLVQ